jgi:hypothetical protein
LDAASRQQLQPDSSDASRRWGISSFTSLRRQGSLLLILRCRGGFLGLGCLGARGLGGLEGLLEVGDDIFDVLGADGDADEILRLG